MKTMYSILKFLIGWPFTILALFFIIKLIAPQAPTLFSNLHTADPFLLFYGISCFVIFYFVRSYIWHQLLSKLGYELAFKESSYLWAFSELKRYIPGNIWSFLGRTVLFSQKNVKKADIGKSLIIEAELFVLGCLVVSTLSLPFILPGFNLQITSLSGLTVFALLVIIVGAFIFLHHVIARNEAISKMSRGVPSILLPPYSPQENFFLVMLSSIALLFFGLGNYFIIGSILPLHPQLILELTGFFVLAFVAGYLSILTPAGFGVREGIIISGLSKITSISAASFAALFSRLILILSELIFIGLAYLWHKTSVIARSPELVEGRRGNLMRLLRWARNDVLKIEHWLSTHTHEIIVGFLATIYSIYFATVSFLRYDNFYTGRFDLGNMAQTVWNTAHGKIFLFTNPNGTEPISRLAFHADFILILLAPFYALWSSPKVILLIQAVVVSAGAFFVYLIAKHIVKNKNLSLVFALAYLINPSVQRANLYDFHAVTLATTFLLATYYFYIKRKYILFIVFAILAALCKEQIWAIIAIFGIFLIIRQRQYLLGTTLFAGSVAMFYFLIWHAIPNTFGANHFALSYYSDFGDGPSSIVKSIIFSPDKILSIVFEQSRLEYLEQLFAPLGYLPFLAPVLLIFAGPDLAINLLSNNAQLHQIYYQYTATVTPFLFIAAINGARLVFAVLNKKITNPKLQIPNKYKILNKINSKSFRFKILNFENYLGFGALNLRFKNTLSMVIISYLLFSSLSSAYHFGPLPGAQNPNLDMITKPLQSRVFIDQYLSSIPKNYKVTASNNVASHLSEREHIYVAPLGVEKADMVILLLTDQWSLKTDTELLNQLLLNPNFTPTITQPPFYVFTRIKN